MMNLINQQLELVLEEMDLVTDTYQRASLRVQLINALGNLTTGEAVEPEGKEAIKKDNVKETYVETEAPVFEEPKTAKKADKKADKKEKKVAKTEPAEIELEPKNEIDAPLIVSYVDEEDGETYEVDVTEAWVAMGNPEATDDLKEIAKNLTLYALVPVYETLSELENSNSKMMLAYYLQEHGVEAINGFINELTDGQFSDVYEFANNDNVEGLIANIEEESEEESEE